ncbi:MAG: hypothetical protein ACERKX_12895, partial [Anaerolineales bacterium]
EEIVYGPDGKVLNPNLSDYKMPTIADVPRIEPIIVEAPSPHGPYGAKGRRTFGASGCTGDCQCYRESLWHTGEATPNHGRTDLV